MFVLVGLFLALLVLVSMWIGVMVLRKSSKQSGPRLMFGGCIALSVGLLGMVLVWVLAMNEAELATGFYLGAQLLNFLIPLGLIVFMVGFTLHALQVSRAYERIGELETIISAQQEQLAQYESRA